MNKVIYIEKTDISSTLTTFIYCGMWQLWSAEQQGIDGYLHWPDGFKPGRALEPYLDKDKFADEPNMFHWWFRQPKVSKPPARNECTIWTWESWRDECPVGFMAQPLSVIKEYYQKNLIFNNVVDGRGLDLVNKYEINFDKTIGITWRGTDNVTDGRIRMPIEAYYPFIDKILLNHPDCRIMCTAEEEGILDPLLKRYPSAFKIEEFFSSPQGGKQNPEKIPSSMSGFERGMQPTLMVWLFSKCAYYIKNRSSTGAVASWLSKGKVISLAHEETLSYLKCDDQVEIEGIKYPLNGNTIPDL